MRTTELMIGDWVKQCYDTKLNAKITEIYPKGFIADVGDCKEVPLMPYEIEPISITPEILEKNGFEKEQGICWTMWPNETEYLDYYFLDNRLVRIYIYKTGREEITFTCRDLKYVHELQHALRLCGVDKEIEL